MDAEKPQFYNRPFWSLTLADFVARTAYQMGKTPLLPILAAVLGATDILLGVIVSVSTLTGMFLKPFVGLLSDRGGRRLWLLIGTAFFAFVPFTYGVIQNPAQLFVVRIIHGMATAIYGPVTISYIAEQQQQRTAEALGWFGWARSGGYIVGPALGGWFLLWLEPAAVFTVIGVLSCAAFLPIALLPDDRPTREPKRLGTIREQLQQAWISGMRTPAIWVAGGLEAIVFVALYALKVFLPIHALGAGFSVAAVGLFFSVQEIFHLVGKPLGGRLGDRWGYRPTIISGMLVLGMALPLLAIPQTAVTLFLLAVLLGGAQALVFPCTVAMIADQIDRPHLGAGFGFLGTLQNGGKVLGPLVGGVLIVQLSYEQTLLILGVLLALVALVWWVATTQVVTNATSKTHP